MVKLCFAISEIRYQRQLNSKLIFMIQYKQTAGRDAMPCNIMSGWNTSMYGHQLIFLSNKNQQL